MEMEKKSDFAFDKEEENCIRIERKTRESLVKAGIEIGNRRKFQINTSLNFFNHMIETIAWRVCMNIDVEYTNSQYKLMHVITEDTGIALGKAFRRLAELKSAKGINGNGSKICGIDEALALVTISFEGRSNTFIDTKASPGSQIERVEDMLSQDLPEFFNGFSQGAGATIIIKTFSGENPHHTWEAIFRAFGEALKECFTENSWRAETTAGVKGTME